MGEEETPTTQEGKKPLVTKTVFELLFISQHDHSDTPLVRPSTSQEPHTENARKLTKKSYRLEHLAPSLSIFLYLTFFSPNYLHFP